jgi:hypothetical protein
MRSLLTGDPSPKPVNRGKRSVVALAKEAGVESTRLVRGACEIAISAIGSTARLQLVVAYKACRTS